MDEITRDKAEQSLQSSWMDSWNPDIYGMTSDEMTSDKRKAPFEWMENPEPMSKDASSDGLWTTYKWMTDTLWPKSVMYF